MRTAKKNYIFRASSPIIIPGLTVQKLHETCLTELTRCYISSSASGIADSLGLLCDISVIPCHPLGRKVAGLVLLEDALQVAPGRGHERSMPDDFLFCLLASENHQANAF